ncbi:DUF2791 family P-loop domain-containing protein [Actinocorallia sp. API 0066]|uniref:LuxR family transcriptional regulator n=1 Tax=Actinocorallia sp. API 0066 TaxID=2896846 RepID=UPI001E334AA8|nr:LuxR family transcriptional regulator [Actinocorallia sp. API 0066]MCD0448643.1 DUF2791 family P-loop domain-containing protein [Actinocorallia sp. API 0066]
MHTLAGREQVLSALGGHLDAAARGSGSCVIVEGTFGSGKSRLLKAVALEAAERGLTVLSGRASATEQPLPVPLLVTFLRHVTPDQAGLDDLADPDRNHFWVADRVGELVERATGSHPLLIVLDDAQWIDDASAMALRGLVQSLASAPVLWLLGRRPVATRSLAQQAVDWLIDHVAVRLRLGALDNEAVIALCADVLGAKPDSSLLSWAARCGGNPWLMENLFGSLLEAGQVVIVNGTASVVAESLPDSVIADIGRLLEEIPPRVRRLLAQGRRIGRTFTVEAAAAELGEPVLDLASSADVAVEAGLVRRTGEELALAHDLIGEVLQRAEFPVSAHEAPTHGSVPPTVVTIGARRKEEDEGIRSGNLASTVRLRPVSGPGARLEPALAHLAVRPPAAYGCGCEQAVAPAMKVLVEPRDGTSSLLARALRLLAGAGRDAEAGRLADIAHRSGPYRTLVEPHRLSGPPDRIASPRSTPACCGSGERPLWTWLVRALGAADRFEEAAAVCGAVRLESERLGEPLPESLWHGLRAELLIATGRLEEARAEAESALLVTAHSAPADSVPARLVLARLSLRSGDLTAADDRLRTAERLVLGERAADRGAMDLALARFHAVGGRPSMTVRTLVPPDGRIATDLLVSGLAPTAAATVAGLAEQAGHGAEAARMVELFKRLAEQHPEVPSLRAAAEHAEGVLQGDLAALHRSVAHYRRAGRPLAAAGALEDTAREEWGQRDRSRAILLLESALDLYLSCGARRDTGRVQERLRELGAQEVRGTGRERPKTGWESLTSAELRVVRAIVDGRTNREAASVLFLSPHTVDSHLRKVFAKLDINNRVELTKYFLVHRALSPGTETSVQAGVAV